VPRFGLDLNENVKFPAMHHVVLLGPFWTVMDQNGAINGVWPVLTCKPLSLTVLARYWLPWCEKMRVSTRRSPPPRPLCEMRVFLFHSHV
jgi:hypothetical protein